MDQLNKRQAKTQQDSIEKQSRDKTKTNVEQSPDHHPQSHITDCHEKEYIAPANYPLSVTCFKRVSKPKSKPSRKPAYAK